MFHRNRSFERRARGYWVSFAVGLFLVIVLDLFTTVVATSRYGLGVESNPVMRWLLGQGLAVLVLVHVAIVFLVVFLFSRVLEGIKRASKPMDAYLETVVQVWLGLLIAAGVFVVSNNSAALFLGSSIL